MAKIISPVPEPTRRNALADALLAFAKSKAAQITAPINSYLNPPPVRIMFNNAPPAPTPTPTPTAIPTPVAQRSPWIPVGTPQSVPNSGGGAVVSARNPSASKFSIAPQVHTALSEAAQAYKIPPSLLYDIALQESSFNPTLVNTTPDAYRGGKPINPTGLFQFTDDTWDTVKNYAAMPNSSLKLPNFERTDPKTNALAAAYLIKFGQLGRWDASKNVWGPYYKEEEISPYYAQTMGR